MACDPVQIIPSLWCCGATSNTGLVISTSWSGFRPFIDGIQRDLTNKFYPRIYKRCVVTRLSDGATKTMTYGDQVVTNNFTDGSLYTETGSSFFDSIFDTFQHISETERLIVNSSQAPYIRINLSEPVTEDKFLTTESQLIGVFSSDKIPTDANPITRYSTTCRLNGSLSPIVRSAVSNLFACNQMVSINRNAGPFAAVRSVTFILQLEWARLSRTREPYCRLTAIRSGKDSLGQDTTGDFVSQVGCEQELTQSGVTHPPQVSLADIALHNPSMYGIGRIAFDPTQDDRPPESKVSQYLVGFVSPGCCVGNPFS